MYVVDSMAFQSTTKDYLAAGTTVFSWFLFAGFFILPGAFKSLELATLPQGIQFVQQGLSRAGLISTTAVSLAIGSVGTITIWILQRADHQWLLYKLTL